MPQKFYTLREVRAIVRCSKSKLYLDRVRGLLGVTKIGRGLLRISRRQLEAYLRAGRKKV